LDYIADIIWRTANSFIKTTLASRFLTSSTKIKKIWLLDLDSTKTSWK